MGMQRMSPKSVRRVNRQTADSRSEKGIGEFVKIGVWSDPHYAVGVTAEDEHWTLNRKTGEVGERDMWRGQDIHWSSCNRPDEPLPLPPQTSNQPTASKPDDTELREAVSAVFAKRQKRLGITS